MEADGGLVYGTLTRRFAARAVARPELQLVVRVKALQERPGGRRPPTRGLPATSTKVGECLGRALSETSNEKSVAQHFTLVDGGIPTTKPKGGRRTQFAESPRARDRSEEEKDHRPGRARGDFAVTTSVGRVLRQEPPSATEQVVLKVR